MLINKAFHSNIYKEYSVFQTSLLHFHILNYIRTKKKSQFYFHSFLKNDSLISYEEVNKWNLPPVRPDYVQRLHLVFGVLFTSWYLVCSGFRRGLMWILLVWPVRVVTIKLIKNALMNCWKTVMYSKSSQSEEDKYDTFNVLQTQL